MKKNLTSITIVIGLCLAFLVSCEKPIPEEEKVKLNIPNNIIVRNENNNLKYFTIENSKLKEYDLEITGDLRAYNEKKNLLIYCETDNYTLKTTIFITDGIYKKKLEVDGIINKLLINDEGTKVLYKLTTKDEITEYWWFNIDELKLNTLSDDILISGDLVEFINEDNIIFYGVDINRRKSGLFKLDLNNNEYDLLYEISNAFVDYIKVIDDNIMIFIQSTINNGKKTYLYNYSKNNFQVISEEIKFIDKLVINNSMIYFTGELIDESYSLYSLDILTKVIKRLIYDFPENILQSSELILQDNKIFFVGYNENEYDSNIYYYNLEESSIRLFEEKNSEYRIIAKSR